LKPVISAISIKNFKSLRDTGPLNLKPITLLVGPNSSGKSALLQALLLLKQTLESRNILTPLVIRGKYVNLGSYKDIIFQHDINRSIEISLMLNFFRRASIYEDIPQEALMKFKIGYKEGQLTIEAIEFSVPERHSSINILKEEKVRIKYNNLIKEMSFRDFKRLTWGFRRNFLYIPSPVLSGLSDLLSELSEEERRNIRELLRTFRRFSIAFEELLVGRTYYIGPLREYPQRYYIASGEYPRDVGLRGEHTVEVIYFDFKRQREKFEKLKHWLRKMDIAADIRLKSIAEGIYALTVFDPNLGIEVNLADIGFGASQLLPILVEGIYAKKNSIFLIEQPEIHLHPRLQAALADFFIEMANEGKQLIIETHSEHIVLRLQRRIAEGKISNDKVAIYAFEPSKDGTKIIPVKIDEYGRIKSWPKGFFEDDLEEAYSILEAIGSRIRGENVSGN